MTPAKQITSHDDLIEYNRRSDDSRYDEDMTLTGGSTDSSEETISVAVHLGVKMADTLSFTAKVDMVYFWV